MAKASERVQAERRRRRRREMEKPRGLAWPSQQVLGAAAIILGVLLFVSVVGGEGGMVTRPAGRALRVAFGIGSFLVPLFVVAFGLLAIRGEHGLDLGRIGTCLFCMFLFVVGIAHLRVPAGEEFTEYHLRHFGGYLGAGVVFLLRGGFGQIEAYVVLTVVLFVGLALASERPLTWYLAQAGRGVWLGLKWAHHRAGELAGSSRRQEEKKRRRPRRETALPERKPAELPVGPAVGKEIKPSMLAAPRKGGDGFTLPSLELLSSREPEPEAMLEEETQANISLLEETLASFNIQAQVVRYERGPVITRYEVDPAPGIRVSRVTNLSDDLAMALAAVHVRVEAPVPGKSVIGIEVPNKKISFVSLRSVLESNEAKATTSLLKFALGKDIAGHPMVGDLAGMPHLLISGATNSGKSVCLNSIIVSLLLNAGPKEIKLVLIDPKRVELSFFEEIPHLMTPIIHDAREASHALRQAIKEMERRYRVFSPLGVKNIAEYNEKAPELDREPLPYIIIIIDELADLMMQAHSEFERLICRLAQLARATGIHLVIATQRPTTDIITGTIKANVPSRIAFAVSSQVDSRTILDCNGAERLIGSGDMLFLPLDAPKPVRIQGAFVSTPEIERLVGYLREQAEPEYSFELPPPEEEEGGGLFDLGLTEEEYLSDAVEILRNRSHISVSLLQRKLRIGFNRAARLVEILEEKGIVGPADGVKPRKVLLGLSGPLPVAESTGEEPDESA